MTNKICDILIEKQAELTHHRGPNVFVENPDANALINNLNEYPHAFVLACLMDRQQPAERSWMIPYQIQQKIGSFRFNKIQDYSEEQIIDLMGKPEPLHRFSENMGKIFYQGIQRISQQYSGIASNIWKNTPASATIVKRFLEFSGAGLKISTMVANILVRDFNISVSDKISIDISVDTHIRRVFPQLGLVQHGATDEEIIYTARELSPLYPGIFDLPVWEIGRTWCHPQKPECNNCYMRQICPSTLKFLH